MDEQEIWARLPDEPPKWYARFLIYRNMPATDRSLLAAVNEWLVLKKIEEIQARRLPVEETTELLRDIEGQIRPYKNAPGAWRRCSEQWTWRERAEAYDAHLQAEQEERQRRLREFEAAEIERIMTTDYAAKHERVKALAAMAHLIEESFRKPDTDEIVFQWLSPEKIKEWRGCLDDIAKELGDRIVKKELTGKNGGPLATNNVHVHVFYPQEDREE